MTVMTAARPRCDRTDLHRDECAHCVGDDGTPGMWFSAAPPIRKGSRVRPGARVVPGPVLTPRPSELVPNYPLLCALGDACRDPERGGPRQIGGRSHLCPVCEDTTRERLEQVADAWPDLQARLTAIRALDAAGFITGDSPGTGIMLCEAASDAMHEAGLKAHFYARVVMLERGHTPPDVAPPGVLRWLAKSHVPWLAKHPDQDLAVAFAIDAADLARHARSAAYPAGWRTIPIPLPCHVQVTDDPDIEDATTRPCPGRMTASIRPDLHRLPDLVCDTDAGHTIPPDVWQRQGWKHAARNERATRAFLDAIRG